MYRAYCLNYILNEWGVKLKNTNFCDRVLQHNAFLNKRIWNIRCVQTHCQLSKFTKRDMPFKTKFTALVTVQGLTDGASLKIIRIMAATLGGITDLNPFLGGVYDSDSHVAPPPVAPAGANGPWCQDEMQLFILQMQLRQFMVKVPRFYLSTMICLQMISHQ